MKNGLCVGMLLLLTALVAGCGGGGGGSNSGTAAPGTVKAVMKTTALSPAAGTVGAISATISFPDGVYAKTDASGAVVVADVITLANSTLPAGTIIQVPDYLPAVTGHSGLIKFTILNADGFNATEAVTISLLIRSGTLPKAADFALVNFVAKDLNGADVTTLKPTLSATVQ
jgi:hypothetical protein